MRCSLRAAFVPCFVASAAFVWREPNAFRGVEWETSKKEALLVFSPTGLHCAHTPSSGKQIAVAYHDVVPTDRPRATHFGSALGVLTIRQEILKFIMKDGTMCKKELAA